MSEPHFSDDVPPVFAHEDLAAEREGLDAERAELKRAAEQLADERAELDLAAKSLADERAGLAQSTTTPLVQAASMEQVEAAIGAAAVAALVEAGHHDAETILSLGEADLKAVPGIGRIKVEALKALRPDIVPAA